jgi:ankyrin repeat protein
MLAEAQSTSPLTDIDHRNEEGLTSLQVAAMMGNDGLVQMLLEKKADPNASPGPFGGALYAAAERGHFEVVQTLVKNGANVEAEEDPYEVIWTRPLEAACANGHMEIVNYLLDKNADPNADDGAPLNSAAAHGYLDIVHNLLNKGAQPSFKAAQVAAAEGEEAIALKIIAKFPPEIYAEGIGHGCLLIAAAEGNCREVIVKLFKERRSAKDIRTALQAATENDKEAAVQTILEQWSDDVDIGTGSDPSFTTDNQDDLVCTAVRFSNKTFEMLLGKLAEKYPARPNYWRSLKAASTHGHTKKVEQLLCHGIDMDGNFMARRQAMLAAAASGHADIVALLIHHEAPVDFTTATGTTPLYYAAICGRQEVLELLIKNGAKIKNCRRPPLVQAAGNGHTRVVKLLLERGADINARDVNAPKYEERITALTSAIQNDHLEIVEMLIEKGAKMEAADER